MSEPRRALMCWKIAAWTVIGLLLAACGSAAPPTATPAPRDDSAIRAALANGPHGDTYHLNTGPNTYCAQCKSPANYDPQAVIDAPPNCVTCKFPGDTVMRVAAGNPLVPEHEWQGIRCKNCHPIEADGTVQTVVAWWSPLENTYSNMPDSTALCEQCHRDSAAGTLRQREIRQSAVHTDATCTTCHDAHSAAADCAACHNADDTATEFVARCWTPYLAPDAAAPHRSVRCEACHDNGGLAVDRVQAADDPFDGQWTTWRTTMIAGIIPNTKVWVSHNLAAAVDCARCHYDGNSWALTVEVLRP